MLRNIDIKLFSFWSFLSKVTMTVTVTVTDKITPEKLACEQQLVGCAVISNFFL
jgi:hypothetical protein